MDNEFEAMINELEGQLRRAMLASDVAVLDKLLAPELIFTNHLGQCLGKEADISAHRSGALTIAQLIPSEQKIQPVGENVAVVSVRVRVSGKYAGQPADGEFRFTRVWAPSPSGQWQVVAAHAGTIV